AVFVDLASEVMKCSFHGRIWGFPSPEGQALPGPVGKKDAAAFLPLDLPAAGNPISTVNQRSLP
ncbi:MAG: hypothetical protein ACK4NH_01015, partial [Gemmobacter sp.]